MINTHKTSGCYSVFFKAERALDEFGLSHDELRHLKGELIRSPYHDDEFIQVYLEEEVNALVK